MSATTTTHDHTLPRPITLRRKLSFARTLLSLAIKAAIFLLLIAALATSAIMSFRGGDFQTGMLVLSFALALFAFLFVWFVRLRYHVRRTIGHELRKRNCCPHCSYDLRASATRCPECGHPLRHENIEV